MRLRTLKHSTSLPDYTTTSQSFGGSSCSVSSYSGFSYNDSDEFILDYASEKKDTRHKWNACIHNRLSRFIYKSPFTYAADSQPTSIGSYCLFTIPYAWGAANHESQRQIVDRINNIALRSNLIPYWNENKTLSPVIGLGQFLGNWQARSANAVQSMWPKIKTEMSLINSIYELKDFKTTPRMVADWGKLLLSKKSIPLRRVVRELANANLFNSFALQPLMSDIAALRTAISTLNSRVQNLLKLQDRWIVSHYQERIDAPHNTEASTGGYSRYSTGTTTVRSTLLDWSAWYRAQMEFSYKLTSYQREHARELAILDSLGINYNPAIIWNALPWSFVVDWIFRVGKFLDQYQTRMLDPKVVIRRFMHSVKIQYRLESELTISTPVHTVTAPLERVTLSTYVREHAVPNFYSLVETSGISPSELILAGSLVLSRL